MNLQQTSVERQALARDDVADDFHPVGLQQRGVIEPGRVGVLADPAVLDVAHAHECGRGRASMSDGDAAEAIAQGRQVAHAQIQEARGAGGRIVHAIQRLGGATQAVALGLRLAANHQCTAARDLVLA